MRKNNKNKKKKIAASVHGRNLSRKYDDAAIDLHGIMALPDARTISVVGERYFNPLVSEELVRLMLQGANLDGLPRIGYIDSLGAAIYIDPFDGCLNFL